MGCIALRKLLGHRVVAVPDATSLVGAAVVRALQLQSFKHVVIVAGVPMHADPDDASIRALNRLSRVEVKPFDPANPRRFLSGVHAVFVTTASTISLSVTRDLLTTAHDICVPHIVFQSWVWAGANESNPLHDLETHLTSLRPHTSSWTVLRLPFLLDFLDMHQIHIRLAHQLVAGLAPATQLPVLRLSEAAEALIQPLLQADTYAGMTMNVAHAHSTLSPTGMASSLAAAMNSLIVYRQVDTPTWIASWSALKLPTWWTAFASPLTMSPMGGRADATVCEKLGVMSSDQCHFETLVGRPPTPPQQWFTPDRFYVGKFPTKVFVVGLNDLLGARVAGMLAMLPNLTVHGCDNVLGIMPEAARPIPGVVWVHGRLQRPNEVRKMLKNMDVVLYLPSRSTPGTILPSLLRGAKAAKVMGFVLLSTEFAGSAEWDSPFQPLLHIENEVRRSGLRVCILRIPMLMEVALDYKKRVLARNERLNFVPDSCRLGMIAADDAAHALRCMCTWFPLHASRLYLLHGDELTLHDMCEKLGIDENPPAVDTTMAHALAALGDVGDAWWSAFHFVDYAYWCRHNMTDDEAADEAGGRGRRRRGKPSMQWILAMENHRPMTFDTWAANQPSLAKQDEAKPSAAVPIVEAFTP
ncbi:hypothetical protein DYB36_012404 [Aphanomyces astaci]|uniref:NAD(P)-binding domain-containing protein n=1 Tax=Aphanomyces astaci TaxID=112090 RepID=A0A396ZNS0_APHAT|nr:hypothetical protein DYB36_012404 [Aphanomyces astaci]